MTRQCVQLLCQQINISMGEKNFKSEACISCFLYQSGSTQYTHRETPGGFISGDVKLATTLCLLAGGDAMDLGVIFDITFNWCLMLMYKILEEWICATGIGDIDMESYARDVNTTERTISGFPQQPDGVLVDQLVI